jgi:hypothetical protein
MIPTVLNCLWLDFDPCISQKEEGIDLIYAVLLNKIKIYTRNVLVYSPELLVPTKLSLEVCDDTCQCMRLKNSCDTM